MSTIEDLKTKVWATAHTAEVGTEYVAEVEQRRAELAGLVGSFLEQLGGLATHPLFETLKQMRWNTTAGGRDLSNAETEFHEIFPEGSSFVGEEVKQAIAAAKGHLIGPDSVRGLIDDMHDRLLAIAGCLHETEHRGKELQVVVAASEEHTVTAFNYAQEGIQMARQYADTL